MPASRALDEPGVACGLSAANQTGRVPLDAAAGAAGSRLRRRRGRDASARLARAQAHVDDLDGGLGIVVAVVALVRLEERALQPGGGAAAPGPCGTGIASSKFWPT